ncbi:2Fe-2S iron-sulfur cluster-binding protein [Streptomyces sp. NPDC006367]|uniref:(2Fe-2S)-binding protein n=1 Tax=unclassified Streptomyces TaxID=2593676 RepID=UPI0033A8FE77
MTDDQHGQGTSRGGGRWDPLTQGDYDDGATAFVQLPEGGVDALPASSDSPLAAPGHGYVPPQITVAPATTAGTDPAATGSWTMPSAPADGTQWHAPETGTRHDDGQHAPGAGHEHAGYAQQDPYGQAAGYDVHAGQDDRFAHRPGATGQWDFSGAAGTDGTDGTAGQQASGHDVTGQWSVPVAGGELPDESGEYSPSSLTGQWGGTAPATLPGGAPAPWAAQPAAPSWEQRTDHAHQPGDATAPGTPQAHPAGDASATGTAQAHPAGDETDARTEQAPRPDDPSTTGIPHAHPSGDGTAAGASHVPVPGASPEPAADARPEAPAEAVGTTSPAPSADETVTGDTEETEETEEAEEAPVGAAEPSSETSAGEEPEPGPEDAEKPSAASEPVTEPVTDADPSSATEPVTRDDTGPEHPADPGAPAEDAPGEPAPAEEAPAPEPVPAVPHEERPLASYVLRVNDADRPVTDAWIGESLLYVLRERLGLAGAKDGCSQGECGACNVQVDGRLVASCLVPAVTAAGSEVRTVEGLAVDGRPSDVQRALARCGAVQCGFCVPGMAMTVHNLLEGNPAPTELEARQALCGNLCRCSGYRGVLEAVKEVVAEREAHAAADAESDEPRIPHQAGPGAGGVNPSAFESKGPPAPHDQTYGGRSYGDQAYDGQAYDGQAYDGQAYDGRAYGDQPYDTPSHHGDQPYDDPPYGDHPHGQDGGHA